MEQLNILFYIFIIIALFRTILLRNQKNKITPIIISLINIIIYIIFIILIISIINNFTLDNNNIILSILLFITISPITIELLLEIINLLYISNIIKEVNFQNTILSIYRFIKQKRFIITTTLSIIYLIISFIYLIVLLK